MAHIKRINEKISTYSRNEYDYNIISQVVSYITLRMNTENIKISYNSYFDFNFNIMLDVVSMGRSFIDTTINVSGNYKVKINGKTNTKTHSCDVTIYDKTDVKDIVKYFDDIHENKETAKSIIHSLRNNDNLKTSLRGEFGSSSDPRYKWFFGEFMDILYNELVKEFNKL